MISSECSNVYFDTLKRENNEIYRSQRNFEGIRKWCRQSGLISEDDQEAWYDRQNADPTIRMYEIINVENDLVGVCGLTSICMLNRRAEFSLYIFAQYQRMGYAREALDLLFTHGFNDLGLNLIYGETFQGNPAAQLFEDIGMIKEGTRRDFYYKAGEYLDAHLYSVKADQWT